MLKNNTKNIIISDDYDIDTGLGLMFSINMKKPLLFNLDVTESYFWHMFFVFHIIDIIFLDINKQILYTKENFMPFTFFRMPGGYSHALELSKGSIRKYYLEVGDYVEM
jgi:uncharacterized membrane protein (UPF0127 family)